MLLLALGGVAVRVLRTAQISPAASWGNLSPMRIAAVLAAHRVIGKTDYISLFKRFVEERAVSLREQRAIGENMKKSAAWVVVVVAVSSISCATYPPLDPSG